MPAAMSAVEGRADVVCQGLSGPFIAISGHSLVSKTGPLKGRNRPITAIRPSRGERQLWDRKAVVQLLQSVRQLIAKKRLSASRDRVFALTQTR